MEAQPDTPLKTVQVFEQLDKVYSNDDGAIKKKHEPRFVNLKNRFKTQFGHDPKFYGRAPGRVNIIGEHIDYCGYSVLPAAIEQDFIMAYSIVEEGEEGSDLIQLTNIDKDSFPEETLSNDPYQKMFENAHWVNYFLCGYKAILAHNKEVRQMALGSKEEQNERQPKGLKIMIDSQVPPAAGLSSSSAFTVCAAVTAAHANGILDKISMQQLADLTINAERMAGTACGGMDQTISIMGEMGTAKHIEFIPNISADDVKVPSSVCLVIANSVTPSPKLLTLGTRYNKRVCECRFALAAMTMKAKLCDTFEGCPYKTFEQLQSDLKYSFEQMIELVNESFSSKSEYTPQKMQSEFKVDDIWQLVGDVPHVLEVKNRNASFELYKRAYHVLTEAKRVLDFKKVCNDDKLNDDTKIQTLGKLMNESHLSCKMYYDCSSNELDEITQLARDSGALGSRLTGAGWGGCSVSLVKKDILSEFIDKMYTYYTKKREPGQELWVTDDLDRYIFASEPAQGACVINPQYTLWHV